MSRIVLTACLSVTLCGPILAQESAPQPSGDQQNQRQMMQPANPQSGTPQPGPAAPKEKRSAAKKKASKAPAQAEPAVGAPAPVMAAPAKSPAPVIPPTLMNQPPVSPTVTMRNGLLTIDAPNSTLSEVLNGVRRATGAVLEGISPSDRVAVRLGPGNPREVVAALLQGTPYDYLILASDKDPKAVTRILVTQGNASSEPTPPAQPQQPAEAIEQPPPDIPEYIPDQGDAVTGSAIDNDRSIPPTMPPPGSTIETDRGLPPPGVLTQPGSPNPPGMPLPQNPPAPQQ